MSGTFDEAYFWFDESLDGIAGDVQWLTPAVGSATASSTIEILASASTPPEPVVSTWLFRIFGNGPTATGTLVELPVPPYGFGSDGPTHAWMWPASVVARSGRLVAALLEMCTPRGDFAQRACARVFDLDTSGPTPTRRQDFFISQEGVDVFGPGLALTLSGDLVITFQRNWGQPSAYVVQQSSTDAPNTISTRRLLSLAAGTGQAVYHPDLLGLQADPLVPDAVWVINQSGGPAGSYDYQLQTAQARTATGDTFFPIDAAAAPRYPRRHGPVGCLPAQRPADVQRRRRLQRRDPDRRRRDHRQPDGRRPDERGLRLGRTDHHGQPDELDDQLPGR